MVEYTRRKAILSAASISTITVAGCLSDGGGPSNDGNGNGDENGNGSENGNGENDDSSIGDPTIETTDSDCGGPDDYGVDATLEGDTLTVTGVTPASNPCHDAVLEDSGLEDGQLSLVIGVQDTTDDDGGCMQCTGAIEYAVEVDVSDATVDSVEVDHVEGETYTVDELESEEDNDEESGDEGSDDEKGDDEEGDDEETSFELGSTSIDLAGADCKSGESDAVSVDVADEIVTIDGVLEAPTPCYEPILEEVALDGATLDVVVSVRSTLEEGEACNDCVGQVEYEAQLEVTNAADLDGVHVDHVGGGSHATSWDEASESAQGE